MTEELFTEKDQGTPTVVENEDGSIKIGETVYRTKEDAFKGKAEADKHIQLTHAENATLREQVKELQQNQGDALQTLLKRMEENETRTKSSNDTDPYREYIPEGETTRSETKLDEETIQELVARQVKSMTDETDQQKQEAMKVEVLKANAEKIRDALIEKFGSKDGAKQAWDAYRESPKYNQRVYDVQLIEDPGAIIEAISGKESVNLNKGNVPGSYSVDTYIGSQAGQPHGWSHYSKLLKEKKHSRPGGYYHPKTQIQLKADRVALGEAFMGK